MKQDPFCYVGHDSKGVLQKTIPSKNVWIDMQNPSN